MRTTRHSEPTLWAWNLLIGVVLCALLVSCGKDDELGTTQETAFRSYFTSSPYISALEVDSLGGGVWTVLENPRTGRVEVALEDIVFFFEGYVFSNSLNLAPVTQEGEVRTAPFYTNNPLIINKLEVDTGSDLDWSTEPVEGAEGLISGLRRGLAQSCRGDNVLVFLTSEAGYGNEEVANLPKDLPLVFRIIISD